jgi:hypothetical protein
MFVSIMMVIVYHEEIFISCDTKVQSFSLPKGTMMLKCKKRATKPVVFNIIVTPDFITRGIQTASW